MPLNLIKVMVVKNMNRKFFVVSDVHGHCSQLANALAKGGFDKDNPRHVFVSCGDLFDRGKENVELYNFVKGIRNKILIKGNHEDILYNTIKRGFVSSTDYSNGTDVTISQFLGQSVIDKDGYFDIQTHSEIINELSDFIDSMLDYYEIGKYVFTHGWLPIIFEGKYPKIDENWRNASVTEWEEARVLEWQQLYSVNAIIDGKIIVCGHRPSYLGHNFDFTREPDDFRPFYGNGTIAIDASTIRSGIVNLLVINESEC